MSIRFLVPESVRTNLLTTSLVLLYLHGPQVIQYIEEKNLYINGEGTEQS